MLLPLAAFTRPVLEYHNVPRAAAPPTDPIRIPPRPDLGLYPTPVDSTQLRRPPPPYPPPSEVPSSWNMRAFVEWQRELARKGEPIKVKHMSLKLLIFQEEVAIGGSGIARVKSREVVESNKEDDDNNGSDNNGNNEVPLAQKCPASPTLVASEEGEKDMEMREMTPLATVAEVEREVSDMEVKGKEEQEAATVASEEDKGENKGAEEAKGIWSNMPLHQVGNDELEWLGEDLAWLTPLTLAASLSDFDKRAAGVEWRFQRELEVARKELVVARAWFAVAK
ncbi:hypothetical protein E4T56_gene18915 [Termitomyces sp. T112]|nr:hypothetical protein E4T56_gene18915 [Termitomyces sp. T112]